MTSALFRWQSGTATLLALGVLGTSFSPMLTATPAAAQLFRRTPSTLYGQNTLPAGTLIPATYKEAKRIIIKPDETLPLKLTVTENVLSPAGAVLIPAGSELQGELQPTQGGTQFVSRKLILPRGETVNLLATSAVITRQETIKKGAGAKTILTGALVGGATATIISAIVTDVGVLKSLGGAGAGALGGFLLGRRSVDVLVVDPRTDLNLTLNSDVRLDRF